MYFRVVQQTRDALAFQVVLEGERIGLTSVEFRDQPAVERAIEAVIASLREGVDASLQVDGDSYHFTLRGEDGGLLARGIACPSPAEADANLAELQRWVAGAERFRIVNLARPQRSGAKPVDTIQVAVRYDLAACRAERPGLELLNRASDGLFTAHLHGERGEVLLYLRGFTTRFARDEQVESVLAAAADPRRFDRREAEGRRYFVLTARNGREIARGPWLASEAECDAAITQLVRLAPIEAKEFAGARTRRKVAESGYDLTRKSTSGAAGFEAFKADDGHHYFHLNDERGEALLFSHGYSTPKARDHGIRSLLKGAGDPVCYRVAGDELRFAVSAVNGRELTRSRLFGSRAALDRAIAWIRGEILQHGRKYGIRLWESSFIELPHELAGGDDSGQSPDPDALARQALDASRDTSLARLAPPAAATSPTPATSPAPAATSPTPTTTSPSPAAASLTPAATSPSPTTSPAATSPSPTTSPASPASPSPTTLAATAPTPATSPASPPATSPTTLALTSTSPASPASPSPTTLAATSPTPATSPASPLAASPTPATSPASPAATSPTPAAASPTLDAPTPAASDHSPDSTPGASPQSSAQVDRAASLPTEAPESAASPVAPPDLAHSYGAHAAVLSHASGEPPASAPSQPTPATASPSPQPPAAPTHLSEAPVPAPSPDTLALTSAHSPDAPAPATNPPDAPAFTHNPDAPDSTHSPDAPDSAHSASARAPSPLPPDVPASHPPVESLGSPSQSPLAVGSVPTPAPSAEPESAESTRSPDDPTDEAFAPNTLPASAELTPPGAALDESEPTAPSDSPEASAPTALSSSPELAASAHSPEEQASSSQDLELQPASAEPTDRGHAPASEAPPPPPLDLSSRPSGPFSADELDEALAPLDALEFDEAIPIALDRQDSATFAAASAHALPHVPPANEDSLTIELDSTDLSTFAPASPHHSPLPLGVPPSSLRRERDVSAPASQAPFDLRAPQPSGPAPFDLRTPPSSRPASFDRRPAPPLSAPFTDRTASAPSPPRPVSTFPPPFTPTPIDPSDLGATGETEDSLTIALDSPDASTFAAADTARAASILALTPDLVQDGAPSLAVADEVPFLAESLVRSSGQGFTEIALDAIDAPDEPDGSPVLSNSREDSLTLALDALESPHADEPAAPTSSLHPPPAPAPSLEPAPTELREATPTSAAPSPAPDLDARTATAPPHPLDAPLRSTGEDSLTPSLAALEALAVPEPRHAASQPDLPLPSTGSKLPSGEDSLTRALAALDLPSGHELSTSSDPLGTSPLSAETLASEDSLTRALTTLEASDDRDLTAPSESPASDDSPPQPLADLSASSDPLATSPLSAETPASDDSPTQPLADLSTSSDPLATSPLSAETPASDDSPTQPLADLTAPSETFATSLLSAETPASDDSPPQPLANLPASTLTAEGSPIPSLEALTTDLDADREASRALDALDDTDVQSPVAPDDPYPAQSLGIDPDPSIAPHDRTAPSEHHALRISPPAPADDLAAVPRPADSAAPAPTPEPAHSGESSALPPGEEPPSRLSAVSPPRPPPHRETPPALPFSAVPPDYADDEASKPGDSLTSLTSLAAHDLSRPSRPAESTDPADSLTAIGLPADSLTGLQSHHPEAVDASAALDPADSLTAIAELESSDSGTHASLDAEALPGAPSGSPTALDPAGAAVSPSDPPASLTASPASSDPLPGDPSDSLLAPTSAAVPSSDSSDSLLAPTSAAVPSSDSSDSLLAPTSAAVPASDPSDSLPTLPSRHSASAPLHTDPLLAPHASSSSPESSPGAAPSESHDPASASSTALDPDPPSEATPLSRLLSAALPSQDPSPAESLTSLAVLDDDDDERDPDTLPPPPPPRPTRLLSYLVDDESTAPAAIDADPPRLESTLAAPQPDQSIVSDAAHRSSDPPLLVQPPMLPALEDAAPLYRLSAPPQPVQDGPLILSIPLVDLTATATAPYGDDALLDDARAAPPGPAPRPESRPSVRQPPRPPSAGAPRATSRPASAPVPQTPASRPASAPVPEASASRPASAPVPGASASRTASAPAPQAPASAAHPSSHSLGATITNDSQPAPESSPSPAPVDSPTQPQPSRESLDSHDSAPRSLTESSSHDSPLAPALPRWSAPHLIPSPTPLLAPTSPTGAPSAWILPHPILAKPGPAGPLPPITNPYPRPFIPPGTLAAIGLANRPGPAVIPGADPTPAPRPLVTPIVLEQPPAPLQSPPEPTALPDLGLLTPSEPDAPRGEAPSLVPELEVLLRDAAIPSPRRREGSAPLIAPARREPSSAHAVPTSLARREPSSAHAVPTSLTRREPSSAHAAPALVPTLDALEFDSPGGPRPKRSLPNLIPEPGAPITVSLDRPLADIPRRGSLPNLIPEPGAATPQPFERPLLLEPARREPPAGDTPVPRDISPVSRDIPLVLRDTLLDPRETVPGPRDTPVPKDISSAPTQGLPSLLRMGLAVTQPAAVKPAPPQPTNLPLPRLPPMRLASSTRDRWLWLGVVLAALAFLGAVASRLVFRGDAAGVEARAGDAPPAEPPSQPPPAPPVVPPEPREPAVVPPPALALGDCPEAPDPAIGLLVAPFTPLAGEPLRIFAATLADDISLDLHLLAPDAPARPLDVRVHLGTPSSAVAEYTPAVAGEYTVAVVRNGRPVTCSKVQVLTEPPQRPPFAAKGRAWAVERAWSPAEEALYSAWVRQLFTADPAGLARLDVATTDPARNLLHDALGLREDRADNPLALRLDPDGADLPYVVRAYWSWKRRLPFAYRKCQRGGEGKAPRCGEARTNLEPGSGFTMPATELARVQRFLHRNLGWGVHAGNARTAVTDSVSDLYPVRLDHRGLRPGAVYADPYGHVFLIVDLVSAHGDGPGALLAVDGGPDGSIVPRQFWEGLFLWDTAPAHGGVGFKQFRPVVRQPGGGLVQLDNAALLEAPDLGDIWTGHAELAGAAFYDAVTALLEPPPWDASRRQREAVAAFAELARERIDPVARAAEFARDRKRAIAMPKGWQVFEATGAWESHSTPGRDLRLLLALDVVRGLPDRVRERPNLYATDGDPEARARALEGELEALLRDPQYAITYTRSDGSPWTLHLRDLADREAALEAAYNPNDCPELRWGAPEGSDELSTCSFRAPADQRARMNAYRAWLHERRPPLRGDKKP